MLCLGVSNRRTAQFTLNQSGNSSLCLSFDASLPTLMKINSRIKIGFSDWFRKKICLLMDDGIARIVGIVNTVLILGLSYTVYQLAIEIFGHILTVCRSKFRLSVWYQ